jgi:two-component system LytT family response regulator
MTFDVLIVDDEAVARRRIRRLLASEPDVATIAECGDGASALESITTNKPDVVFLDVQMPELDGFEVISALPVDQLPAIVFVTAFDRYAIRAFDVHAIDYLLKPFTGERFRVALARARERLERRARDRGLVSLRRELRTDRRYARRIAVRAGDRYVVIDWHDVDWVGAADNYVKLHVGSREYLVRETLANLERTLDPDQFSRIHRSAIVQLDRIVELRPSAHGDSELRLRDGTRLTLSRTWRDRVALTRAGGHSRQLG